jgi:geranylgeranyl reductase family protein
LIGFADQASSIHEVERFDAIVVGAGPAGSTAALRLARAGARVCLLDRARFPRDKPCGGGLTIRAVRQLPVAPEPVVEHVVDRMELRLRYRERFERQSTKPLILMTQRHRLDHFLVEQAAAAGVDVRDGVKVTDVGADERSAWATANGERVEAQVLVGADGANGTTRKALGLGGSYVLGVAFEGNVSYGDVSEDRYRGTAAIELGTIPGGYGWVFPKGDHVNVGVGGWENQGPKLRGHLGELCRAHGIDEARVGSLRGHRLPLRRPDSLAARGRALLVGDAAGLVDPLSGDGMYEAFVSSRIATECILELLAGRAPSLDRYSERLSRELGPLAAASWGAKIALDRYPRLTFTLGRAPLAWGVVARLLRGDIASPSEQRGLARVPLKLIATLARAAGDPGSAYRLEAQPV